MLGGDALLGEHCFQPRRRAAAGRPQALGRASPRGRGRAGLGAGPAASPRAGAKPRPHVWQRRAALAAGSVAGLGTAAIFSLP